MQTGLPGRIPYLFIYFGEEGICILHLGMHMGDIKDIHMRQCGRIHGGSADYEAFAGRFNGGISLFKGIYADNLGNRVSAKIQHYILTMRKRTAGKRKISGAPHNDRVPLCFSLEIL